MMYSVPDTAFGAAVAQFLVLFQKRPVSLAELHAAFADMAAIAVRDHPEMPWPITQTNGDGLVSTLTVEGWLAVIRGNYARLPILDDAAMVKKLALWHGASVKAVVTSNPWPTELQISFTKKTRTAQGKSLTEQLGVLVAPCSWVLWRENEVVVSSVTVDSQAEKAFSVALKGSKVLDVRLEPGGVLVLGFNKGIRVEVRPDAFSVGPDYSLYLDSHFHSYYRFDGNFVENEQISSEDILVFE